MRVSGMFYKQRPGFDCLVCGKELPIREPTSDRHLECSACGAELVYDFRYFWFYKLICILAAVFLAYLQKSEGFVVLFFDVAYFLLFYLLIGPRYVLPLLPFQVRVFSTSFTALGISKAPRIGRR